MKRSADLLRRHVERNSSQIDFNVVVHAGDDEEETYRKTEHIRHAHYKHRKVIETGTVVLAWATSSAGDEATEPKDDGPLVFLNNLQTQNNDEESI